jgi:hypothetical protein
MDCSPYEIRFRQEPRKAQLPEAATYQTIQKEKF